MIAALVTSRSGRARLATAVRAPDFIHFCDTPRELLAALADGPVSAVIVEPGVVRAGSGADGIDDLSDKPSTPGLIAAIRADFPSVPILAYAPLTAVGTHEMLDAVRYGAVDVILAGLDETPMRLDRIIARAHATSAADAALARLAPLVPPELVSFLNYSLRRARQVPTVAGAAIAIGVHRKTVAARCSAAGLPGPHALIAWCRLLVAAHRLDDPGRPVESVAIESGFASGSAFANMLKRYTGYTPAELRDQGGSALLLDKLVALLSGGRGRCKKRESTRDEQASGRRRPTTDTPSSE